MHILVTGATGFLGTRVLDHLLEHGHRVRALVRDAGRWPDRPGVRPVEGRLEDIDRWADALTGVDAVIHLASPVGTWGNWPDFRRTIVDGTRDLLRAAEEHGVRRFVHISSESVLQGGRPLLDATEDTAPPTRPSSYYGRAKLLAERALAEHDGPIERIVLRPTFIWGTGSGPLAQLVDAARTGGLPLFNGGRSSLEHVHVDNVAAATVRALDHGRDRGVYLITNGEPMPVREFLTGVLAAHGVPLPRRSLPAGPLRALAGAMEALWATLRLPGRPPLTRFEIEFLSLPRRYRIDRAVTELGYTPAVSYADGIAGLVSPGGTPRPAAPPAPAGPR